MRPEKAFKRHCCSFLKEGVSSNKQTIASDTLSVWNWAERGPANYFCNYTPKAQEVKCSSTSRNYLCLSVRWDILHLVCYWPRLPLHFCKEDCCIELESYVHWEMRPPAIKRSIFRLNMLKSVAQGRGCSAVVARSLCMWKAPGSIPGISNVTFFSFYGLIISNVIFSHLLSIL